MVIVKWHLRAAQAALVSLPFTYSQATLAAPALEQSTLEAPAAPGDDWLHAVGAKLYDEAGREVWLTGLNWFGFNTGTNAFDGLWSVNLSESFAAIAQRGFNVIRVPISTELLYNWKNGVYPRPNVNEWANPELRGMNSFEVFQATLAAAQKYGLKLIVDVHSAKTDAMGHMAPLWYDSVMTTAIFYETWLWLADRLKNDDTVIGFDLKNEPHGKPTEGLERMAAWDNSTAPNNFRFVAEDLGKKILAIHPKVLILVEGTEVQRKAGAPDKSTNISDYDSTWWGGNLRGARTMPVRLGAYQSQLVYSPHDYGPAVYRQPWFDKPFNKITLYNDVWRDNWAYLQDENTTPLLIGEWGGFLDGADNEKWMVALRDFIKDRHLHHTFWCFNPNSGDTGGLVLNDFKTWDEAKYALVKPVLWQNTQGKFIGLDHQVPLGSSQTGTSIGRR